MSSSRAAKCWRNKSFPCSVARYVVLGFRPTNCLETTTISCCSKAFRWLARFPSVNSSKSFRALKSSVSFTISADMIPNLMRLSNTFCRFEIGFFTRVYLRFDFFYLYPLAKAKRQRIISSFGIAAISFAVHFSERFEAANCD